MPEYVSQRLGLLTPTEDHQDIRLLLAAVQADLAALRTWANTHVHSGITAGAANSAVATTLVPALNTQP